jgi:hypothetical protein
MNCWTEIEARRTFGHTLTSSIQLETAKFSGPFLKNRRRYYLPRMWDGGSVPGFATKKIKHLGQLFGVGLLLFEFV